MRHVPIVLVAHGSRDPRSGAAIRRLAAAVGRRWPGGAEPAFLDLTAPSVAEVLHRVGPAIVVPALLTHAYHSRVDLPRRLAEIGVPVRLARVLGPGEPTEAAEPLLIRALARRLSELDGPVDGVVLMAAGSSYAPANVTVQAVAARLASTVHAAATVGYLGAGMVGVANAVMRLRERGAGRIAASSYFLAPGRLSDAAGAAARGAGAVGVAAPLAPAEDLVALLLRRAAQANEPSLRVAAQANEPSLRVAAQAMHEIAPSDPGPIGAISVVQGSTASEREPADLRAA